MKDQARRYPFKNSGKARYFELRAQGLGMEQAARKASIVMEYACTLESEMGRPTAPAMPDVLLCEEQDHIDALIAAGGYARLSERETRHGHIACLPLIPFGARE